MKTRILIIFTIGLIGFVVIPNSYSINGGGMVIEVPGQTMDISQNVISPGETMFVNGSFRQPAGDFSTSIFKNYEASHKLVLTLNPNTNEFGDFNFNFTIPEHWELGNYYMILENGLQLMDWKFTVRQNYSGGTLDRTVYPIPWMIESPLKQFKSGVTIDEIQCKTGFVQVFKKSNNSPACVTLNTKSKLMERGWAEPLGDIIKQRSGFSESSLEDVLNRCADDSPHERRANPLRYTNETHVFLNLGCKWQEIGEFMQSPEPESESKFDTGFSQRYQISIFQNLKTMSQYFTPDFITIGPVEEVTWSNHDKISHTIISNNSTDPWSTGIILPREYATISFEKPGIYWYHGKPWMNEVVIVVDDDHLLESNFSEVFGPGSPIAYNEGLKPVFLYDNCERYVYWLNEHGKEKITLPEDYPRYPPWGNEIFPLVEFCTSNGEIVNTANGNSVHWEFRIKHEN
ncbi:MAG: hypothetical protein KC444_05095 [Nitrosopumilus sp.]|nr:hypothetical protein [Nitrosopumilus sp.]